LGTRGGVYKPPGDIHNSMFLIVAVR